MDNNIENSSIEKWRNQKEKRTKLFLKIKQILFVALMGCNSAGCSSIINENAEKHSHKKESTPIPLAYGEINLANNNQKELEIKLQVVTTQKAPKEKRADSQSDINQQELVNVQVKEILTDINETHLQKNPAEYDGEFDSVLGQYIRFDKSGINYCGEATLLNLLDALSMIKTGKKSGLSILEFMNKYFVVNGQIAPAYNETGLIVNRNGTMSPRAVYGLAEKIASEYGYQIKILHGNEGLSSNNPPIKKSDLRTLVEENQEAFKNGGIAIMLTSRNATWEGKENEEANPNVKILDFYHYTLVTDMVINQDETISFLNIDPLGLDGDGSMAYVRVDNNSYTIPDLTKYSDNIYTGIDKIFLLTPIK